MLGIPVAVRVVVGAKAASVFEPKIAKERMPKASLMIVRASLNVPPTALCTPQYERPIAKRRKRGRGRGSNNSRLLTSFLYSNFHRSLPSCHRKTATRESQPPSQPASIFTIFLVPPGTWVWGLVIGKKWLVATCCFSDHFLLQAGTIEGAMKILDHLEL